MKKQHNKSEAAVERMIKQDLTKRVSYFIKSERSVAFQRPDENPWNHILGHDVPHDKDVEQRNEFYIPKAEYESIELLFREFDISEALWPDLIWAYLNMCFAKGNALWSDKFHRELQYKEAECFKFLELLDEIKAGKRRITEFALETKEIIANRKYGPPTTKRFKGHIAAEFLEAVLSKYKESTNYEVLMTTNELVKKHGYSDLTYGHKNHEKKAQDYYCWAINKYLSPELIDERFSKKGRKKKGEYSKHKLYIFIGKFMQLSGLLKLKDEMDDSELYDLIKKKLAAKQSG